MNTLKQRISTLVKEVLAEGEQSKQQWEGEINDFLSALRSGSSDVIAEDDLIAVEIFKSRETSNDPRYVVYEPSKDPFRLRDDHFYVQNSRPLTNEELNVIKWYAERHGLDEIVSTIEESTYNEDYLDEAVNRAFKKVLKEDKFDDLFDTKRNGNMKTKGMFGFNLQSPEGEWKNEKIIYDPNTRRMSCMGVSIVVDSNASIEENVDRLYDKLIKRGFRGEED